ncbi:hypothetical protein B1H10_05400, partial [candidate division KSB1 bacterium 4484_188]
LQFSPIQKQDEFSGSESVFDELLPLPFKEAKRRLLDNFERFYLSRHLKTYAGNISKLAEIVGESREGLSKKIKRYGLKKQ